MRIVIFSILVAVTLYVLLSCESPSELERQQDSETQQDSDSPSVFFTINNLEFSRRDTLRLSLHVFDTNLSCGSVNYDDGSIVEFKNLNQCLDTTLIHIYTKDGNYKIKISFSDFNNKTTKEIDVSISSIPFVSLSLNKTILDIKDTLQLNIHASHRTLTSGILDFGDGTIINFLNLPTIFDTTIFYNYSQMGTFNISTIFRNKDTTSSISSSVDIKHYYSINLSNGMKWKYKYHRSHLVYLGGINIETWGIREWEIIASANDYTVREIITDTIHHKESQYDIDSTYVNKSVREFSINISHNNIVYELPYIGGPFIVPNNSYINSYPIIVKWGYYPESSFIKCEDIVGITKYYYSLSLKYSETREEFYLVDFSP